MQSKSNMPQIHSVYHGSVPALYLGHKTAKLYVGFPNPIYLA